MSYFYLLLIPHKLMRHNGKELNPSRQLNNRDRQKLWSRRVGEQTQSIQHVRDSEINNSRLFSISCDCNNFLDHLGGIIHLLKPPVLLVRL
jgi:hypothetical protein